jgi:hypothetical protein
MKQIPLTQNKFTLVDDEDFDFLNQWKWYLAHGYAVRTQNNYGGKPKQIRMHRIILGTPDGLDTDHKNRDRLDNRRENLRVCNRSQNVANTFVEKQNHTGFKGVSWKTSNKKWVAQIRVNNVVKHLGLFDDIKKAIKSYDLAAKKYFGEFAVTNENLK